MNMWVLLSIRKSPFRFQVAKGIWLARFLPWTHLESRETWSTQTTWYSQWKRGESPGKNVGPVKRRVRSWAGRRNPRCNLCRCKGKDISSIWRDRKLKGTVQLGWVWEDGQSRRRYKRNFKYCQWLYCCWNNSCSPIFPSTIVNLKSHLIICSNQMFRFLEDSMYKEREHIIHVLRSYDAVF